MSGEPPLNEQQNERARAWLTDLLALHKNHQAEVAKLLDVSHATISRVRSGKLGTSVHVVKRMARLLGRNPGEVIFPEFPPPTRIPVAVPDSRFPSSHAAQQAASLMGCHRSDIENALERHGSDDDPGDTYWIIEFLHERDRRRRREQAVGPSSSAPTSDEVLREGRREQEHPPSRRVSR